MAALATSLSCFTLSTALWHTNSSPLFGLPIKAKSYPNKPNFQQRRLRVMAATEGSAKSKKQIGKGDDPSVPTWARPGSDEPPPWAQQEAQNDSSGFEVPFYVYLLASAITAIAAIGSIFEYVNQKPVFGVVNPDSAFYAPLLGFFALTGIPSSAFLWFKSVQAANKEAEEQDRRDGYR